MPTLQPYMHYIHTGDCAFPIQHVFDTSPIPDEPTDSIRVRGTYDIDGQTVYVEVRAHPNFQDVEGLHQRLTKEMQRIVDLCLRPWFKTQELNYYKLLYELMSVEAQ